MKSILLYLLIITLPVGKLTGKVTKVIDGDTIEVLVGQTPYRIRLEGIDCPEKNQDFGQRAKQFTSDQCFGKIVTVESSGEDRYGRTLGRVIIPDGKILNELLVKEGFAWHYTKYSNDRALATLQAEAKQNKRGLWQIPNPTPPWEFRKNGYRN